ncbi:MAG: DUF6273 domain-containing protein [Acidaminococcaceae bacterium]
MLTKPMLLDETGNKMIDSLDRIAAILASGATYDFTPTKLIALVESGLAPYVLPVGSQLIMPWTDKSNANTVYQIPWDVLAHETCLDPDGNTKPCMTLGWHYTTPYGVQFSNYQAFYSATAELPAGTYYITVGTNWGTYGKTGETYSFTLTQPVPIGGQLSGFEGLPDANPTGWKVKSWTSNAALAPIETVSVTAGANGTSLGQLKAGGDGTLNCIYAVAYGYNRWSTSAMRQWLNSDKVAGAWWTPQHKFDRVPTELATKPGFLTGLDVEFKQILPKSKITTALNTVSDVALGATEVTVDKVFLASLEQMYVVPQLATVEGPVLEYWKVASGRTTPLPTAVATPEYVCYGIDNTATAQYVRLRSATRGFSTTTWSVNPSGYVNYYGASISWRCLPVVRIY